MKRTTTILAATAAAAALALTPTPAFAAETTSVTAVGSQYLCSGHTLTATTGSYLRTSTSTPAGADTVRLQDSWTVETPITLVDETGATYTISKSEQWGDVTVTGGDSPVGTFVSKIKVSLAGSNATWGTLNSTTIFSGDWAMADRQNAGSCKNL